jgi:hypothetical protein
VTIPDDLLPVIEDYRTCEFLTVSKSGAPIAWPTVSVNNPDGTFTISTSIGLPQKAFNVRRNPKVALLFSDPTASGVSGMPQLLVKGTAVCPDEVVTSVSRYREGWYRILTRQPDSAIYSSRPMRPLMDFYYMRLLITVTPTDVVRLPAVEGTQPLHVPAVQADAGDAFRAVADRLPAFTSAVLCGFDDRGVPCMIRTRPAADPASRTLRVTLPPEFSIAPGQGGILCHSHDEKLGKLRSFAATGAISTAGGTCVLTPERYIAGAVPLGPTGMIRAITDMRRASRRYLERRGLTRPRVAWDDLTALKADIKRDQRVAAH